MDHLRKKTNCKCWVTFTHVSCYVAYNFEPPEPIDILISVHSVRVIGVNKIPTLVTNQQTYPRYCISLPEIKWLRNFGTVLRILYVDLDGLTGNVCEGCRLLILLLLFNPTHALTYSIKTPTHTNI
jgi:hypothetical protein